MKHETNPWFEQGALFEELLDPNVPEAFDTSLVISPVYRAAKEAAEEDDTRKIYDSPQGSLGGTPPRGIPLRALNTSNPPLQGPEPDPYADGQNRLMHFPAAETPQGQINQDGIDKYRRIMALPPEERPRP